ncbi:MAG TPA: hypothetical protein ACFE0H_04100 [Elainellaceae cyanobacterium]|jgi:hypothetical protein
MNAFLKLSGLVVALTVGMQWGIEPVAASGCSSSSSSLLVESVSSEPDLLTLFGYVPPDTGGPDTSQGSGTR